MGQNLGKFQVWSSQLLSCSGAVNSLKFSWQKCVTIHRILSTKEAHLSLVVHSFVRFVCFCFLGPHPWQMEVPIARGPIRATTATLRHSHSHSNVGSELRLQPTLHTVHGNARSLTYWTRPGVELASSWILISILTDTRNPLSYEGNSVDFLWFDFPYTSKEWSKEKWDRCFFLEEAMERKEGAMDRICCTHVRANVVTIWTKWVKVEKYGFLSGQSAFPASWLLNVEGKLISLDVSMVCIQADNETAWQGVGNHPWMCQGQKRWVAS